MLDDMALFARIVEHGSLSAAARHAGMPPATVTRRLQQLEQALGCQLLHRSARRLLPTPEGLAYYERCRPLLAALQQAMQALDAELTRIEGRVRVLAPINLAQGVLRPVWSRFLQRHPDVQLDLRISNLREDVFAAGADLAIRVGEQPDSALTRRGLGQVATGLVAAPAYLARQPAIVHPDDLLQHAWIVAEPLTHYTLTHPASGEHVQLRPPQPVRSSVNDLTLAVDLAAQGHGVLFCPLSLCDAELRHGTLQRVLSDWHTPIRPVGVVWPQQRHLPARVRALVDLLVEFAAGEPLLQATQTH